jgi:Na+-translocating ferredoxin:NAD+ oxidoreductase subunit B
MGPTILYTVLSLSILGVIAAIILFIVAQKFMIIEDPRIDDVTEALPSANCGGCGFAGCRNFAENFVNSETLNGLYCPVGGNDVMSNIANILGRSVESKDPRVAVLRCNGSCQSRPQTNIYDGAASCAIASALYGGNTDCQYGCLGLADCVDVCIFNALKMDPFTGLPVIDDSNCTACGACVKSCPKNLFELRKRAKKDRKIYVACRNEEKGGIAKKSCSVACIGCEKCVKVCPHEAIVMNNNLAFIDSDKCKLCRKCVTECPTDSIIEIGFPERKDTGREVESAGLSDNDVLTTNNSTN